MRSAPGHTFVFSTIHHNWRILLHLVDMIRLWRLLDPRLALLFLMKFAIAEKELIWVGVIHRMSIKTYSKCIGGQLLCSASTDVAASSSSDSNKLLLLGIIDMLLLFAWPRTPIDPSLYV